MKNRKGFTIVELVIVIAVIAILAAVLIPTFTTVTANARASAALQQAKSSMESLLSNTEGQMSTGSLFVVTNQKSYEANYFFVFENGALSAKSEKEMNADDGKLWLKPTTSTPNNYYRVFVASKAFATAGEDYTAAEIAAAKSNVTALLQSVLRKAIGEDAKEGVLVLTSFDNEKGYVPGTFVYTPEGGSETTVDIMAYTSGDLADTCVALIK